MRISVDSEIGHPRAQVYETYRDRLPEVAGRMPDVAAIIERSREAGSEGPRVHNEWVSRSELPRFVRPFVSSDILRWDDYAQWCDADFSGTFDVRLRVFTDQVTWRGHNRFLAPTPGTTTVRVEGRIDIDLASVPGVPRWLAGTLGPRIERYVARVMTENLHQMNASVERHLAEQQRLEPRSA